MDSLVSVIIPIYNACEYLDYSVNSVCSQTYKNIEIILVDDNSEQKTKDKIDELKSRDNRIRVITKSINEGVSASRNSGIEASNGDYIAFVDADDYVSPDYIKELLLVVENTNSDLAFCKFSKVKSIANVHSDKAALTSDYVIKNRKEALLDFVGDNSIYSSVCWNKLFKKELIHSIRFPEYNRSEDLMFCMEAINQATRITYLNKNLYFYISNSESITHRNYDFSIYDMDIWDRYDQIISDFEDAENIKNITLIRRADSIIEDYYRARKNRDKNACETLSLRFIEKVEQIKKKNIKLPLKFRIFILNSGVYMLARNLYDIYDRK